MQGQDRHNRVQRGSCGEGQLLVCKVNKLANESDTQISISSQLYEQTDMVIQSKQDKIKRTVCLQKCVGVTPGCCSCVNLWLDVRVEKYHVYLPYSLVIYLHRNIFRVCHKVACNVLYATSRISRQQSHHLGLGRPAR